MSTRALVVDDSVLFRRVVSDALAGLPGLEVVGTASNGKLALDRLRSLTPDVMTLDIEMPEMNGLEVLEAMKASGSSTGVIVLSSQTLKGGAMTIRALELGAFDFLTKPQGSSPEDSLLQLRGQLQPILQAFERRREIRELLGLTSQPAPAATLAATPAATPAAALGGPTKAIRTASPLVLIGVSTGGPAALAQVLPALPADLPAPVFIVQHMPRLFTEALARSLQAKCALRVKEAADGEIAQRGVAYIAPGGRQMKLASGAAGQILIQVTDDPPENNCRPAVDYLFRSVALHFPGRAIATILTGMGADGAQGLRLLKRGGCTTIAQDEATCVVYGMPREAVKTGTVDFVLPLPKIAAAILRAVAEAGA